MVVHDYAATPKNSPSLLEFEYLADPAKLKNEKRLKAVLICCPWDGYRKVKFPKGAHRYLEISQFVGIAGAIGCVMPDRHRDFDFRALVQRIRKEQPQLKHGIVLGEAPNGFVSLDDLIEKKATRDPAELRASRSIRATPRCFFSREAPRACPS